MKCYVDIEFKKSGKYGIGRETLPRQLAVPLSIIAKKIGAKPFMEYALSYALYNYTYKNKELKPNPLVYDNLKLIRTFDGSLAEHGFILVGIITIYYTLYIVLINLIRAMYRYMWQWLHSVVIW